MKKSYLLLGSVVAFMVLFYKQEVGVNLFIFNVLLLIGCLVALPQIRKNKSIGVLSAGALITSGASAWYADFSSIFLNILTLLMLPIFLHRKEGTILFSETLGLWNVLSAPFRLFTERKLDAEDASKNLIFKRILLYGALPFVVLVLFIYLYRFINPVWGDYIWHFIENIFSWTFIMLLILATILMYAFWYFVKSSCLERFVTSRGNELTHTEAPTFKNIPLSMEMGSGVLLFALLNLLLFSLLATDFQQLFIDAEIPEGYTLSEYLHKGVYAVILSIIFAIGLIVFYFKGAFNYNKKSKVLRVLTWVWIALNAILVVFTFYKNILYVEAYDLTFKRVSVFIYLVLCWVGLYFTSVKLKQKKTFVYIVRKMYWAFYIMWVLTTPINWTSFMTTYNLNHAKEKNYKEKSTDVSYLTGGYKSLNELNIGALVEFLEENPDNPYTETLRDAIDEKFLTVLKSDERRKWRGKRLYDLYIKKKMADENYQFYSADVNTGKFYPELESVRELDFEMYLNSEKKEKNTEIIKALKQYKNVENLTLRGDVETVDLFSLKELESMKKLRELTINFPFRNNDILTISGFPKMESLRIYSNNIKYLEFQDVYPNLKTLELGGGQWKQIKGFENLAELEELQVGRNNLDKLDIEPLKKLKRLSFECVKCFSFGEESLANLEELSISGFGAKLYEYPKMSKLKGLSCKYAKLKTLDGIENFPNVQELDLSYNQLEDISDLKRLSKLNVLDFSSNTVSDISFLKQLPELEELNMNNNPIGKTISVIYELPKLRFLYVDYSEKEQLEKEKLPKKLKINGESIEEEVGNRTENAVESARP